MLSIILGVFTISLGAKAFSATGLPLTRTKNITGKNAKITGIACIILGVLFLFDGLFGTMVIIRHFSRTGR